MLIALIIINLTRFMVPANSTETIFSSPLAKSKRTGQQTKVEWSSDKAELRQCQCFFNVSPMFHRMFKNNRKKSSNFCFIFKNVAQQVYPGQARIFFFDVMQWKEKIAILQWQLIFNFFALLRTNPMRTKMYNSEQLAGVTRKMFIFLLNS